MGVPTMERYVVKQVAGTPTIDGAGVSLTRVLAFHTAPFFDPILVLDLFDSTDSNEYAAGFPLHPHRGIECISYLRRGHLIHRDSLGHEEEVGDGDVQWMCAGSGIMHEEFIPTAPRQLGVQLWLNLPCRDKMARPAYRCIRAQDIEDIRFDGGDLRLLAGSFGGSRGCAGSHLPLDFYHVSLEARARVSIPVEEDRSVMAFAFSGDSIIAGSPISEHAAAKLSAGDFVTIAAPPQSAAQVLFVSSQALNERIAWQGPIVMSSDRELEEAYSELKHGTFLRSTIDYQVV